jgi:hypothetical protein
MTLYGVDISNNSGSGLNIAEIQGEGFSWVEAKVSQGNYFHDTTWPRLPSPGTERRNADHRLSLRRFHLRSGLAGRGVPGQRGRRRSDDRLAGLISSAFPDGTGYASVIYENAGGGEGEGWATYGNATPVIWQFTDQASVDGKTLDANAFRGTQQDLTTLLGPGG